MKSLRTAFFLGVFVFVCRVAAARDEEIVSHIRRVAVASSNVASIGYSRHLHALEIEFTRGAVYRFLDVPKAVYRDLMESGSKGHFIAEHLRNHYRFVRVRSGEAPANKPLVAHD